MHWKPEVCSSRTNNPNLEILNGDVNEAYHSVGMF